jgi:hypothetical protein
VRNEPGPVSEITTPDPTNSPAPITPPMAIILSWRWLSAFVRVGVAVMSSSDVRFKDSVPDPDRGNASITGYIG